MSPNFIVTLYELCMTSLDYDIMFARVCRHLPISSRKKNSIPMQKIRKKKGN